ncbi:MAG TPA: response regulator [Longimicrobium sp.]|nr:response regulator [Longimicrobium sp.]
MSAPLVTAPETEPRPPRPNAPTTRLPSLSMLPPPMVLAEGQEPPSVLIAEDHEDSRDALKTLLDALGYRVHEAATGAQAVEQARLHRPDLILMDMMMPHVDGFQATRMLRADPDFREVPIIAVTAMEGARPAVLDAGCDDLVTKPVDIRSFIDKVRVWLSAGRNPAA